MQQNVSNSLLHVGIIDNKKIHSRNSDMLTKRQSKLVDNIHFQYENYVNNQISKDLGRTISKSMLLGNINQGFKKNSALKS